METDKQLYKLFTAAPGQLYLLLGLPAPKEVRARAETFKDVQTESDLVAEPGDEAEPARLVDFQAYRDKKFVPKVMLRCALYRLQHPARPMRSHIVYLDREFESAPVDDGGLFQPTVHYLPELFRQLTIQYPDSPLVSVLRPLVVERNEDLIATAMDDQERIRHAAGLTDAQRQAWLDVFHSWLMIRLPLNKMMHPASQKSKTRRCAGPRAASFSVPSVPLCFVFLRSAASRREWLETQRHRGHGDSQDSCSHFDPETD